MKRIPAFEIVISILFISITIYGALSDAQNFPRNWFDRDDAYYYFKVAQNISEGLGSTFDGVDLTNGYHPLWMLICIPIFALARYDLILPLRVLFVLMGLLQLGTAILLYRWLKHMVIPAVAMLATGFWLFDYRTQVIIYRQGLETGIAAFNIVLLLYLLYQYEKVWETRAATRKEVAILAIVAVLVMLSRLDLVFLVMLIGFRIVFRETAMRNLLGIDMFFIFVSVLASFLMRIGLPEYYLYSNAALTMTFASLAIRLPIFCLAGMYERPGTQSSTQILVRSLGSVSLGSLLLTPVMLILASSLHFEVFPRSTLFYEAVILFTLTAATRLIAAWFTRDSDPLTQPGPLFTNPARKSLETLVTNWRSWLTKGAVYYGIVLGTLAIYMVYNHFTFGTSSPVSGQVKRWWGSFQSNPYGGAANNNLDFFGVNHESDFNAWPHLASYIVEVDKQIFSRISWDARWQLKYGWSWAITCSLFVLFLALQRKNSARLVDDLYFLPMVAASWIQVLSYNVGGYAAVKEWYWVTQTIVFVVLFALVIESSIRPLARLKGGSMLLNLVAASILLINANQYYHGIQGTMPYNHYDPGTPYLDVVSFIEANTEPGASIGMTGGGNVGYFINDRTVVNMDGLINSYDYFKALQNETADEKLEGIGLDYVFANLKLLDAVPYRGQFNDHYVIDVNRFGGKALIRYGQDE